MKLLVNAKNLKVHVQVGDTMRDTFHQNRYLKLSVTFNFLLPITFAPSTTGHIHLLHLPPHPVGISHIHVEMATWGGNGENEARPTSYMRDGCIVRNGGDNSIQVISNRFT